MIEDNPFLAYAMIEKSDDELRVDECYFKTLLDRINSTFLNKEDQMGVDGIFNTLDKDGDNYIGIEDVLSMNKDLGTSFNEDQVKKIMEQISDHGSQINKEEFKRVFWR